MEYGTLRVTTPDGQVREYPIEVQSVVIGRAEGSGVVIDHVTVSRRHAQLRIDDGKVTIEDLGSNTGTFVGSQRLGTNEPATVGEGQPIRFGDVEARFFTPNAAPVSGAEDAAAVTSSSDTQATVAVSLKSPTQPVAAGAATTATVVIQNRGQVMDQLSLSVPDVPAAWVRVSRPQLSLVPGARDEVTIVIQPPRTSEAVAGEYPFAVAVDSKEYKREVRVLGRFAILPFEAATMSLEPARTSGETKLIAENEGNSPLTYALSAESAAADVSFGSETLELKPGEKETVTVRITPKKKPLFGKIEQFPFQVAAKPVRGSAPPLTATGQLAVVPPLRWWRWPVAAVAILAVLGIGWFGYSKGCGAGWPGCGKEEDKAAATTPTPTAVASETPAATGTPAGLRVGGNAIVADSPAGSCLALRSSATRASDNKLGELCDGERVKVTAGPTTADGFVWWSIETTGGLKGWSAEKPTDGSDGPWLVPAN